MFLLTFVLYILSLVITLLSWLRLGTLFFSFFFPLLFFELLQWKLSKTELHGTWKQFSAPGELSACPAHCNIIYYCRRLNFPFYTDFWLKPFLNRFHCNIIYVLYRIDAFVQILPFTHIILYNIYRVYF